jgi:hypothetical protein
MTRRPVLETHYRKALGHLRRAYEAMELPLVMMEEAGNVADEIMMRGEFRSLWHGVKEMARCQGWSCPAARKVPVHEPRGRGWRVYRPFAFPGLLERGRP